MGLAGIMGGENSEIVEDTVDVVFESANFNGTCIRKGALALGMRTEASAKFEKGLDILNTLPAVNRACELVELLGAGEVVDGVIDILNYAPNPTVLKLEPQKINALLGTDVDKETMVTILKKLDFEVEGDNVTVPSWRGDVKEMAASLKNGSFLWLQQHPLHIDARSNHLGRLFCISAAGAQSRCCMPFLWL